MQKLLKLYITLVFLSSQLFSENYQKLVLIEFDNSSQDRYFDFYRQELPNIIKNHPSLNDIEMEYAGKIDPYLDSENNNINTVLLLGKFFIEDSQIEISYSLYDMSTWKKINEKIFYCMVRDSECISSSMIVSASHPLSSTASEILRCPKGSVVVLPAQPCFKDTSSKLPPPISPNRPAASGLAPSTPLAHNSASTLPVNTFTL